MNLKQITVFVIGVVLSGVVGGYVSLSLFEPTAPQSSGEPVGGEVVNSKTSFTQGIFAGLLRQFSLGSSGETRAPQLVQVDGNGSFPNVIISTTSPNSVSLTADQVCNNPIINVANGVSATGTVVLPSSTAMTPTCLPNVGDSYRFSIWNSSSSGVLTLGTGNSSTIQQSYSASTTTWVAASSTIPNRARMKIEVQRVSSGTQSWLLYDTRQVQ